MENTDTTKTKKCCDCKLEKPLSRFSKNKSQKDGLDRKCKLCRKNYHAKIYLNHQNQLAKNKNSTLKAENIEKSETRKCNACGNVWPLEGFYKIKKGDKITIRQPCKKCFVVIQKLQYHKAEGGKILSKIDSAEQIDGILRELSETQFIIDAEKSKSRQIIEKIQYELDELIYPLQAQIGFYKNLLTKFFKKTHNHNFRKDYLYGSVNLTQGELILILKPDLANVMKDKP